MPGTANIRFNLFGPWMSASRKFASLSIDIKKAAAAGQRKAADKLVRIVKNHLIYQDLTEWPDLAASTIRKKGGDARILIRTEHYLNNIKAWRKGYIYYVGVKRGVTSDSGLETARVAAIHEFKTQTRGAPRRPLWQPSIEDMGGGDGIRDLVKNSIAARLRMRGWEVNVMPF